MLINKNIEKTLNKDELTKENVLSLVEKSIKETLKETFKNTSLSIKNLEGMLEYNKDGLIDFIENENKILYGKILDDLEDTGIDLFSLCTCYNQLYSAIEKNIKELKIEEVLGELTEEEFLQEYENSLNIKFYDSDIEEKLNEIGESLDNVEVIDIGLNYFNIEKIYIEEKDDKAIKHTLEECEKSSVVYEVKKDEEVFSEDRYLYTIKQETYNYEDESEDIDIDNMF